MKEPEEYKRKTSVDIINHAIQTLKAHKSDPNFGDDIEKATDIGIDLAIGVLTKSSMPDAVQSLQDAIDEMDVLQEMYVDLRLEAGEWIELKGGNELPDYDEYVLWAFEDGTCLWSALDKDGNSWLLEDTIVEGLPMGKATHWRKIKTPQGCDELFNIK